MVFDQGRPKRYAATQPVQTPVPGRGMETKSANPRVSYLSTSLLRERVLSKSHSKNLSKILILRSSSVKKLRNQSIGITGIRLPTILIKKVFSGGSPSTKPKGTEPRTSIIGEAAVINTISSFGNPLRKVRIHKNKTPTLFLHPRHHFPEFCSDFLY